jgi:RNA polymerase sigma-70 factor (ECF subfamily)
MAHKRPGDRQFPRQFASRRPGSLSSVNLTELLASTANGDPAAWNRVLPIVYGELKRLAKAAMVDEREKPHTLQPTALVHEAFMRLIASSGVTWQNRAHFFGAAARIMRRILIDHARRRRAGKRGGGLLPVPLDHVVRLYEDSAGDLLDLEAALERLDMLDSDRARVIELRFFGGLTVKETADALGVSESTVEREWRVARAWLYRELDGD